MQEDDDQPLTEEAELAIEQLDRRSEQGLGNFPFPDQQGDHFVKLGADGKPYSPSAEEMLRKISNWFVKKDNKFYEVDNLGTSFVARDVKEIIGQRIRTEFPSYSGLEANMKDLFATLLQPYPGSINPETSIPIWSGRTVSRPGNTQKIIHLAGLVEVNVWQNPAYRNTTGQRGEAFEVFLQYVIPKEQDRGLFLDWLAWQLQNENKKSKWAVMLYSQKQGTGKSTLTEVCRALFGSANTARLNGVSKLVARFNKEVLQSKLVIVEEVEVKKGSFQANAIKTLITEDSTTVEAKGQPSTVENILCSFLMTTNHLPLWLEEADRRFFILEFNHEGYTNGGKDYQKFKALCKAVDAQIKTETGLKGIYDGLMARDLSTFDAMSLDVATYNTEIMSELRALSPDVVKQQLEELLENEGIVFVPVDRATKLIELFAHREANAQTHLFSALGWKKKRFAWGGDAQRWAWYKPGEHEPQRGFVWVGGGWVTISTNIAKLEDLLNGKADGIATSREAMDKAVAEGIYSYTRKNGAYR